MANQKAVSVQTGITGVEVMIWYNDANNRVGAVEWNIPQAGNVVRIRIWNSNVSPDDPVVDRTEGQGSGAQNVPGNHTMVLEDGDLVLPPYLSWIFNIESVG